MFFFKQIQTHYLRINVAVILEKLRRQSLILSNDKYENQKSQEVAKISDL